MYYLSIATDTDLFVGVKTPGGLRWSHWCTSIEEAIKNYDAFEVHGYRDSDLETFTRDCNKGNQILITFDTYEELPKSMEDFQYRYPEHFI